MQRDTRPTSRSQVIIFLISFIIPTLILFFLSDPARLGPIPAMFLALAFPVALGLAVTLSRRAGRRFTARSLAGGLLLGLLNVGNILCYLRAHQALPHDPALVFALMNLGVVALGTLVGTLAFGERLGRLNAVGVLLAAVAIALLAWP